MSVSVGLGATNTTTTTKTGEVLAPVDGMMLLIVLQQVVKRWVGL